MDILNFYRNTILFDKILHQKVHNFVLTIATNYSIFKFTFIVRSINIRLQVPTLKIHNFIETQWKYPVNTLTKLYNLYCPSFPGTKKLCKNVTKNALQQTTVYLEHTIYTKALTIFTTTGGDSYDI